MALVRAFKALFGLFGAIGFVFMGNSLALSSAGVVLKAQNIGEIAIGGVTACFFIGAIMSSIITYKFISTIGYLRSYSFFVSLFAISALLHSFFENIYAWAVLRLFLGFSYYSIAMIAEGLINAKANNAARGKLIGLYEIIYYTSFGLGVMILSLNMSVEKIFMTSTLLIILGSIPITLVRVKEPKLPPKRKIFIPNIFGVVPLASASAFVGGIAINGFVSMGSVYGVTISDDLSKVSLFMVLAMLGGFLGQLFFGVNSYRIGRRNSILLACIIGLVASVLLMIFSENSKLQCVFVILLGFGIFCLYSLALARANDVLIDKGKTLEVGATLLFCYTTGSLCAPLLIGVMMDNFGSKGFLIVYMLFLVLLFIFGLTQKTVSLENRDENFKASSRPTKLFKRWGFKDKNSN